jgi:hypothetical protein
MNESVVPFPTPDEERARRLKAEVERLAKQSTVEWMYYVALPGYAEKYGVDGATLRQMIEVVVKENEKKAREDRGELRRREDRAEKKRTADKREDERRADRKERDDRRTRREQERDRKEAERERKEAERLEREQEVKRVKREAAFAEIAELPKLTHEARLKEAAKRLGEDFEFLVEEFEVYFAARTIPEDLDPWPEPVDTAELLAAIEAKFRRYVITSDAIFTASVLYVPFTYVIEVATHAPKMLYTFPTRNAGKSTILHVGRWMVQRPYAAIDVTGPVLFRIIDHLKPVMVLDEADTLFQRRNVVATVVNESWTNTGSKVPRSKSGGKGYDEYDIYSTQMISMRGLKVPDMTLSRCIIGKIWPKLESEVVEDFGYCDDDEFKVIRRKLIRLAVDNAVILRAANPDFPAGFVNRVRLNWKMLLAIADLAGGKWVKRARDAALELEAGRDEPDEAIRLFQGLLDVWGDTTKIKRASSDICAALKAHPSGEWANFRGKGPIGTHQLAALLRDFDIRPIHNLHVTGRANDNSGGYRRDQFKNAWARLLQKPSRDSLTRSPGRSHKPRRRRKRK